MRSLSDLLFWSIRSETRINECIVFQFSRKDRLQDISRSIARVNLEASEVVDTGRPPWRSLQPSSARHCVKSGALKRGSGLTMIQ